MLDKTIPHIIFPMKREAGTPIPQRPLPPGYSFRMFQQGYEKEWARIEASVGEFDCELDALLYFQREFMAYPDEITRRCIFVEAPDGEIIGTASAWWCYIGKRRRPRVHWVAIKPEHQGMGLGKPLVTEVLRLMLETDGDDVFYLSTQTWSYKAVGLYKWAGFYITDEKDMMGCTNDRYDEAVALIDAIST